MYHQKGAGKKNLTDALVGFCETIEEAGYYAGIYASSYWFEQYTDLTRLTPYDLWIASWSNKRPSLRHGMWQYTSKGRLAGYGGDLDLNYDYKDYPAIIKAAGLNGFPKNTSTKAKQKSVDVLAKEVMQGLWGNGKERKDRLSKAGYNYEEVQKQVNKKLK